MNRKIVIVVTSIILALCAALVVFFALGGNDFFNARKNQQRQQRGRLIIPGEANGEFRPLAADNAAAVPEDFSLKIPMNDGEVITAVVNQDFNGDSVEDQFIAYRSIAGAESPVYAAYVEYDAAGRGYKRVWSAPAAATRQGTISMFTQDIVGDRSACVIITGMNGEDEHTMTIFRWNGEKSAGQAQAAVNAGPYFVKIAELRIDGSIKIQETERTQAYQLGIADGQSFAIAAYGHDLQSSNILDQIEIMYAFNPRSALYEQSKITRIPGSQIEQRRLRELLGGQAGVFENFINDLWYYVSPQGTLDSRQFIYFDPESRELIFYIDETQQVFNWQNSTATRYGLYIASQNISVSTLRRFVDIELESLDSIRVKVFEDVRLKIGVGGSWDGSYRRAGTNAQAQRQNANPIKPALDAAYDSSLGRFTFAENGRYTLSSGDTAQQGAYVFFEAGGEELLELRPAGSGQTPQERAVYRINRNSADGTNSPGNISLTRVRLGTTGIEDLHEGIITMTPAAKS